MAVAGGIGPWIAAGAPGGVVRETPILHAHPVELFGPTLSARQVAGLLHIHERSVQRFAAATTSREPDWCAQFTRQGPGGELQTICQGQRGEYVNAEREPLPLLLGADCVVLRTADGTCFAVVAGPSSGRRGRPKTTCGESPWQFRQSFTGGSFGSFDLPSWWPS